MADNHVPDWTIIYGDGSIYTSDDGDAGSAPATDVQIIVQFDEDNRWSTLAISRYYIWGWRGVNKWWSVDDAGFYDYLLNYRGWKAVLVGRWVDNETFRKLWSQAQEMYGEKVAFAARERQP